MKYLHTMVRVSDLDQSLDFYCNKLGLKEVRRMESPQGRFTLVYLAAPGDEDAQVELTYNWDPEAYGEARNFGHLAYEVDDIYAICDRLMATWPLSARPTIFRSSSCKRANRCRSRSRGRRCRIRGSGERWYPLGELNSCFQVENLTS